MASKLKRYIHFSGNQFYAAGGWHDFEKSSDDIDKLISEATKSYEEYEAVWSHILDTESEKIVFSLGVSQT